MNKDLLKINLVEFSIEQLKQPPNKQQLARIHSFSGDHLIAERLKEMGVYPGLELQVVGRAPFCGPFLFRFGNTVLALRSEEAVCAIVQKLDLI